MPTAPTTAAPTAPSGPAPGAEYNPAAHVSATGAPRTTLPGLTEALSRAAGVQPPAPKPAAEPPKPAPVAPDEKPAAHVKFISPDERTEAPAAEAPKPAPAAEDEPPAGDKPLPPNFREALDRVKGERNALREERDRILAERDLTKKEAAEFRAKLAKVEERAKALEGSEARTKELEKQLLSYDEQLRISNYLAHPEFHEKYVKPVADAVQSAYALVKDLSVETDSGTRPGAEADFQDVLAQPNTTRAMAKAVELFGERIAPLVVEARAKVQEAERSQAAAVKNAGLKSQEWLQQREASMAARREQERTAFFETADSMAKQFSSLYLAPEGDREAHEARQTGEQLAKIIIDGIPEGGDPRKAMNDVAKVYQRAASWPMLALRLDRMANELEATKARLAAYEKSTPSTAGGRSPDGGVVVPRSELTGAGLREALTKFASANPGR